MTPLSKFLPIINSLALNTEAGRFVGSDETSVWCEMVRARDAEWERLDEIERMLKYEALAKQPNKRNMT